MFSSKTTPRSQRVAAGLPIGVGYTTISCYIGTRLLQPHREPMAHSLVSTTASDTQVQRGAPKMHDLQHRPVDRLDPLPARSGFVLP